MTTALETKMQKLEKALKARSRPDGSAKPGYERNVAQIRAEMSIMSSRIELAQSLETNNGE